MTKFEKISKEQWVKDTKLEGAFEDVILPRRGTAHSAGYDFYAPYRVHAHLS